MYITLESDYAIRIVGCLAEKGRRTDAKAIAEQTCVTLRFSLKILRKLVEKDIVKSFKGNQGGYELARTPSEISMKDVIEAVEGKYCLSRCLSDGYECSRGMSGRCKYQRVFDSISADVEKKLEAYTFDMLIDT